MWHPSLTPFFIKFSKNVTFLVDLCSNISKILQELRKKSLNFQVSNSVFLNLCWVRHLFVCPYLCEWKTRRHGEQLVCTRMILHVRTHTNTQSCSFFIQGGKSNYLEAEGERACRTHAPQHTLIRQLAEKTPQSKKHLKVKEREQNEPEATTSISQENQIMQVGAYIEKKNRAR